MTSTEFRSNPELIEGMKKLIEGSAVLSLALTILDDESPVHEPAVLASDTTASYSYGFIKGYEAYAKKFREFAVRMPANVQLEADYRSR